MRDTGDYRGKRIDNGEMVEGDKLTSNGKTYIVVECETSNQYGDGTDLYATEWYEVDPKTVGQCVGLPDANEKDIFKGDIFDLEEEGLKGLVVYDDNTAKFRIEIYGVEEFYNGLYDEVRSGLIETVDFDDYSYTDKFCFKVIGNIHDNPDLLGG